jgi:hypothetical protein
MFVRLRKVVFGGQIASLFGAIGFTDDDGRFISHEAAVLFANRPARTVDLIIDGWKSESERGYPVMVPIGSQQFAVDLTEIETSFV